MRRVILDIDFDFFVRESHMLDWGHGENMLFQQILWHSRASGYVTNEVDLGALMTPPNDPTPEDFWAELERRGWKFGDDDYEPVSLSGDSHGEIGAEITGFLHPDDEWEIWHFDAHHDLGYANDPVDEREKNRTMTCADWLYLVGRWQNVPIPKIVIVYPEWRREPDPGSKNPKHICNEGDANAELIEQRAAKLKEVGCEIEVTYWKDHKPPEAGVTVISTALSSAWVPPWYDERYKRFVHAAPVWEHHYTSSWQDDGIQVREGWPDSWEGVIKKFAEEAEQIRRWRKGQRPTG